MKKLNEFQTDKLTENLLNECLSIVFEVGKETRLFVLCLLLKLFFN